MSKAYGIAKVTIGCPAPAGSLPAEKDKRDPASIQIHQTRRSGKRTLRDVFIQYRVERADHFVDCKGVDSSWESFSALHLMPADSITDSVVSDWIAAQRVEKGYADSTILKRVKLLRSILLFGSEEGMCNPPRRWRCLAALDARSSRKYMTDQEREALLSALQAHRNRFPWWFAVLIRLMFLTGQRVRAVLGLRWAQIGADAIDFYDPSDPLRKRRKQRGIFPCEALHSADGQKILMEAERRRRGPYVLHWEDGRQVSYEAARKYFMRLVSLAGVSDEITLHCIRHTVAAKLIRGGVSLPEVAALLGHKSSVITESVYGHLRSPDFVSRAAAEAARMIV